MAALPMRTATVASRTRLMALRSTRRSGLIPRTLPARSTSVTSSPTPPLRWKGVTSVLSFDIAKQDLIYLGNAYQTDADASFQFKIDGEVVKTILASDLAENNTMYHYEIDITGYAGGGETHTLQLIDTSPTSDVTGFSIDFDPDQRLGSSCLRQRGGGASRLPFPFRFDEGRHLDGANPFILIWSGLLRIGTAYWCRRCLSQLASLNSLFAAPRKTLSKPARTPERDGQTGSESQCTSVDLSLGPNLFIRAGLFMCISVWLPRIASTRRQRHHAHLDRSDAAQRGSQNWQHGTTLWHVRARLFVELLLHQTGSRIERDLFSPRVTWQSRD